MNTVPSGACRTGLRLPEELKGAELAHVEDVLEVAIEVERQVDLHRDGEAVLDPDALMQAIQQEARAAN